MQSSRLTWSCSISCCSPGNRGWTIGRKPSQPRSSFFLDAPRELSEPEPSSDRAEAKPRTMPARSLPAQSEKTAPPNAPNSTAITDWYGEAETSAENALAREQAEASHRSFIHEFAPPEKTAAPGIFGSEAANHRSGTVERFDDGAERYWVSDNCYFDIDRRPAPLNLAEQVRPMTTSCKPPPTGGGDKMFEQLTPSYLKQRSGRN